MLFEFPSYFFLSFATAYHYILGRTITSNYTVIVRFLCNLTSDTLCLTSSAAIHNEFRAVCKETTIFTEHIHMFWRNLSRDLVIARGYEAFMDMEDQFYDIVWFRDHVAELAQKKYCRLLSEKANRVYVEHVQIIFYKHINRDAMSTIVSYLQSK